MKLEYRSNRERETKPSALNVSPFVESLAVVGGRGAQLHAAAVARIDEAEAVEQPLRSPGRAESGRDE